jgi:hypothetical protein
MRLKSVFEHPDQTQAFESWEQAQKEKKATKNKTEKKSK